MIPWHIALGGSTINAAYKTGLLEALIEAPDTAEGYASSLGLQQTGTERVLEVLKELGLVNRDGDRYATSESLREFAGFPGGFAGVFKECDTIEEMLRSGGTSWEGSQTSTERERNYRDTVRGLANLYGPIADELAGLDQREPSHILDIGTGAGHWSLAMAQRFQSARVTGLDFDQVLENFRTRASDLGLSDRIDTLVGDVRELDIPRGTFDRVMIANVLRLDSPDRARSLVELAADIVIPGGDIVIIDSWPADSDQARLGFAMYSLNLAIRTGSGKPHSVETITSWVEDAGLTVVKSTHVGSGPRSGALFASKPD